MAYVPPALRRREANALTDGASANDRLATRKLDTVTLPSLDDIQRHFWPTPIVLDTRQPANWKDDQDPVSADTSNTAVYTATDKHNETRNQQTIFCKSHSTLNASEAEPNKLSYVLLFHDAHPRWHEDRTIYVKTDLQLLPQETPTTSRNRGLGEPLLKNIIIFDQSPDFASQNSASARFTFVGYYDLEEMQILAPKTPELVRMLEQKWTRTNKWGKSRQIQRDSKGWQKSLSHTWAVLKFTKVNEAGIQLHPPKIEISDALDDRSRGKENIPKMSVNEMLNNLRLEDEAKVDASHNIGDDTESNKAFLTASNAVQLSR